MASVENLGVELQRVDILRKEVIVNVSHELRAPLSLIGGYAEMVRDVHWSEKELREEDLNLIIREVHRMSEMVKDILDYSQLQAGYLQLVKQTCDLYDMIEQEVTHCRAIAEDNHVGIKIKSERADSGGRQGSDLGKISKKPASGQQEAGDRDWSFYREHNFKST